MNNDQQTLKMFAILELVFGIINAVFGLMAFSTNIGSAIYLWVYAVVYFIAYYLLMKVVKDPKQYKGAKIILIIDIVVTAIGAIFNMIDHNYTGLMSGVISCAISYYLLMLVNNIKEEA